MATVKAKARKKAPVKAYVGDAYYNDSAPWEVRMRQDLFNSLCNGVTGYGSERKVMEEGELLAYAHKAGLVFNALVKGA